MSARTQHETVFYFNKGVTSPSISDVFLVDGEEIDLTGATVTKFRLRLTTSSVLKVDANATPENQITDKGAIRYDWATNDLDTVGEYYGWFRVTLASGKVHENPPMLIMVDDQTSTGKGVETGDIYQRVRGHIPNTLTALSRDQRYGDIRIQQKIDVAKFKLFSTSIPASLEATVYNPLVLDFLAKKSTIEIIPSAVDYWTDNPQTINTTGTDEVVSYPDRISALWKIYERLTIECEKMLPDILATVPVKLRRVAAKTDTKAKDMVTSDPKDFGREYADPNYRPHLPWSLY